MNTFVKSLIVAGIAGPLLTLSSLAQAKENTAPELISVEWQNPEDFTDVRPSNESRKRFRSRTFKALEKHLNKLTRKLPEGHKLELVVTDLDLAGRVWPQNFVGFGNAGADVRIIQRVDIPRMDFSYKLLDKSGEVVKEGNEELIDLDFQGNARRGFRNQTLGYEKHMLDEWFYDTFPKLIAANKNK